METRAAIVAKASAQLAGTQACVVLAHIGRIETLAAQPIAGIARLVRNPFLVHAFMHARQHAHHFRPARIDADIRALCVHHVDGFGLAQFPRARIERIGSRGERAHGTDIHRIAGEFGSERFLEICGNLHIFAAAGGAEIGHARNLRRKTHTTRALNAARHDRFNERAHVFVFDSALVLVETVERGAAIGHRLILQIAFATLIADGAIERMIDEQEFHHAFARLFHERRVRVDLGGRAVLVGEYVPHLQRTRRLRLRRADPFDKTHTAIARDRQAFVIAEARDFRARKLAGLQQRDVIVRFDFLAVDNELTRHQHLHCQRPAGVRATQVMKGFLSARGHADDGWPE